MPSSIRTFCTLPLALVLTGISWSATLPHPPAKPPSVPNLRHLTRESGYIFAGTVIAVERVAPSNGVPSMKITFHVDQAIRGVNKGQSFVIHEWAGLWESDESYHRGERVLLFLYHPSKLGLTSPVGGQQGRFKLNADGMALLQQERTVSRSMNPISQPVPPGNTRMSIDDLARAIHQAEEE